jgi:uncharacterized membrane protein YesL
MKILSMDSPLMRALTKMWDLMVLNLMTMLFCLPVVTAGASLTAMHHVLLLMARDEEGNITGSFWESFEENLKQGSLMGLLYTGIGVGMVLVLRMLFGQQVHSTSISVAALALLGLFVLSTALYAFPLLGWYENTIGGTIKNASLLVVAYLPRTLLMLVITAAALILYGTFFRYIVPVIVMVGITLPGHLCARLYDPIMEKLG